MSKVDLSTSVAITPSAIFPEDEAAIPSGVEQTLQYLPSLKSFVFLTSPQLVTFVSVDSNCVIHNSKSISLDEQIRAFTVSHHPEKEILVLSIPHLYLGYNHVKPTHIRLVQLPQDPSQVIKHQSTLFVNPHINDCGINKLKFFPDGSRLVVAYLNEKDGPWCKIFTLPESWEERNDPDVWSSERWSVPTSSKTVPCEEVDVFKQGFPTVDEKVEKLNYPDSEEQYFEIYNERYYSSNLAAGFYCLAISPDTTRLLAGTNDGEIYVIDSITLKVLHCKREYGYCKTVTGCAYNSTFAHEEFAVCNEIGVFDIWNIATLDDGSEEASKVHHLQFPPGTSNCVYSPDGKLIALTSAKELKTYVISSNSGKVMFTLTYQSQLDELNQYSTCFMATSLFFGSSCQVATSHRDNIICLWKLPVVYSLKTLCFIILRASIKYSNVEKLYVPSSLKILLKYLYVD